jgi:hypothetical protein
MQPISLQDALVSGMVVHVLPVLFAGLAALLGWVFVALQKKFAAQTGQTMMTVVGAKVAHFAELVVHDLEATLRTQIADASKDGTLTRAEAQKLRDEAVRRVKELLGQEGLVDLQGALGLGVGTTERYIQGEVEKAVSDLPK